MANVRIKQLIAPQVPQILDEEKRIIRLKVSDGDYDRENDRINPKYWRLDNYNPPFVDSHKTGDTADRRLGEVINAFEKDGIYYNDVMLDIPEGPPSEWTEGEKLANRVWKLVKAGKDIRVSVGFIPDTDKIVKNEKNGYDFNGQVQTELSVVLLPANPRAGIKELDDTTNKVERSLFDLLTDAIKDKLNITTDSTINITIVNIYLSYVVFNYWDYSTSNVVDKYYKIAYTINDGAINLIGNIIELDEVPQNRISYEKLNAVIAQIASVINETNLNVKELKQLFSDFANKADNTDIITNSTDTVKSVDYTAIINNTINKYKTRRNDNDGN